MIDLDKAIDIAQLLAIKMPCKDTRELLEFLEAEKASSNLVHEYLLDSVMTKEQAE